MGEVLQATNAGVRRFEKEVNFIPHVCRYGCTYSTAPPRAYRVPVLNPLDGPSSLDCEWERPTITAPPTLRRMGGKEREGEGEGEMEEREGGEREGEGNVGNTCHPLGFI